MPATARAPWRERAKRRAERSEAPVDPRG